MRPVTVPCVLMLSVASFSLAQTIANQEPAAPPSPGGPTAIAQPLAPATSQPAQGPAGAASTPKGTLGPEYVDGSFGFSVRPLANATFDRRKRTVEGRMQLAQFVRLDIGWSMAVRLWASERPIDATAAKEAMQFDLAVQYPDAEITQAEAIQVASRDAVRLAATFTADGQAWLRQHAVIKLRPSEYVLVLLTTPADDREIATQTFSQVLDSFQVVRSELQQAQIDAALDRGIALRTELAAATKKITDRVAEPLFLRLSRDGQPVGLVEIREKPDKIAGREGLRSLQQAWLFNPDQSVQFLQEERFVSADLAYDEWRNLSQLLPSKQSDPQQRLIVNVEAGIRRDDQLIVKYAGTGPPANEDKAIEVESSYASTAWPLLLPRLVDLRTPELYAFSMYDSERRGMTLRTLRVVGPEQAIVGGRRIPGYKIEDSEGLVPPVTEIFVDGTGRLIRLASGPVEMSLATQEQLDKEFGDRIRATQKQFRETVGLPEPAAQPQAAAGETGGSQKPRASGKQPSTKQPRSAGGAGTRRPARNR